MQNESISFQFLLIISSIGAGLSLVALGTYTYMNSLGYYVQPFSWVAIASFSSMLFLASCGIIPLPYVILSEIMPSKVSSIFTYEMGVKFNFCFVSTDTIDWCNSLFLFLVDHSVCDVEMFSTGCGLDWNARLYILFRHLLLLR